MLSRFASRRYVALAAGVGVLLAGCAKNAPQDTFQPEGSNARKIDGLQRELFYISGVVRPIDIAQDNSVRSSYVADAEIEFTGRGVLTDNQKPGFFTRLLNAFSPL